MGKVAEWMYAKWPMFGPIRIRHFAEKSGLRSEILHLGDHLAAKTVELESLKNKIVERAQTPTMIKAKSAAEIRRMVEQENEREFEEQSNGI